MELKQNMNERALNVASSCLGYIWFVVVFPYSCLGETNQTFGAFSCHSQEEIRCMTASNNIFAKTLCSPNSILECGMERTECRHPGDWHAIGKYRVCLRRRFVSNTFFSPSTWNLTNLSNVTPMQLKPILFITPMAPPLWHFLVFSAVTNFKGKQQTEQSHLPSRTHPQPKTNNHLSQLANPWKYFIWTIRMLPGSSNYLAIQIWGI